jgi:hypothetical protein
LRLATGAEFMTLATGAKFASAGDGRKVDEAGDGRKVDEAGDGRKIREPGDARTKFMRLARGPHAGFFRRPAGMLGDATSPPAPLFNTGFGRRRLARIAHRK